MCLVSTFNLLYYSHYKKQWHHRVAERGGGEGGRFNCPTKRRSRARHFVCSLPWKQERCIIFVIIVEGNDDNIGDDNFPCGAILMITISLIMVVILWFYINLGIFTIIALEVLLLDYLMAWNL